LLGFMENCFAIEAERVTRHSKPLRENWNESFPHAGFGIVSWAHKAPSTAVHYCNSFPTVMYIGYVPVSR
jgi:hypothetical protein